MRAATQRGLTLIEAMVAISVMLIGALGMLGLHSMNGDAMRMTQATAIALDLLDQISLWPYGDPRLVNVNTANDGAIGDPLFAFENENVAAFDYDEAGLVAGGTTWLGIPAASFQAAGYQRYWNVSYTGIDSNGNGVPDAARIAVIVRWPSGPGFRRVVLLAIKNNPAEAR
jgi:prepilin-type N-terminal cleavage/methylation domain-containing protein